MTSRNPKLNLDVELAAGGLVWDRRSQPPMLAVIHRPRHQDWTLPKGKQNPGETPLQTGCREVTEELGCQFEVESFAGVTCYIKHRRPKVVFFWNMTRLDDRPFDPNDEVDEVLWLPPDQAALKLTHAIEGKLVMQNLPGASAPTLERIRPPATVMAPPAGKPACG